MRFSRFIYITILGYFSITITHNNTSLSRFSSILGPKSDYKHISLEEDDTFQPGRPLSTTIALAYQEGNEKYGGYKGLRMTMVVKEKINHYWHHLYGVSVLFTPLGKNRCPKAEAHCQKSSSINFRFALFMKGGEKSYKMRFGSLPISKTYTDANENDLKVEYRRNDSYGIYMNYNILNWTIEGEHITIDSFLQRVKQLRINDCWPKYMLVGYSYKYKCSIANCVVFSLRLLERCGIPLKELEEYKDWIEPTRSYSPLSYYLYHCTIGLFIDHIRAKYAIHLLLEKNLTWKGFSSTCTPVHMQIKPAMLVLAVGLETTGKAKRTYKRHEEVD